MKSQEQLFRDAQNRSAGVDHLFLDLVSDGLTREELQKNIDRRPELWGRFSNWLEQLPSKEDDFTRGAHDL